MANREKEPERIDVVIQNLDLIYDNLIRVQESLASGLSGNEWDKITAIGVAGNLIDVCRQDIQITIKCAECVKEEATCPQTNK